MLAYLKGFKCALKGIRPPSSGGLASELFSSDVSLWNQCKYIALSIFSCRVLINSHKMLNITKISNETRN